MSSEEIREKALYYTIIDGTFRIQVPQDHPDAVRRDWVSKDGKESGTKYEKEVHALKGIITRVDFHDGQYGTQLVITLDKNEEDKAPKIQLSMNSREAEQVLSRLPAVDLTKEVKFRPYKFLSKDDGKEVRGIEVSQQNPEDPEKSITIKSFFRDVEGKKNINGFPDPEGDTKNFNKDDWKIYFLTCRKFLTNYTKENVIPKLGPVAAAATEAPLEYPTEDINPEDIPF